MRHYRNPAAAFVAAAAMVCGVSAQQAAPAQGRGGGGGGTGGYIHVSQFQVHGRAVARGATN